MPSDRISQTPEEQGFPVSVILEYHRPSKHSREAAAGTVVGIVAMGSEGEGAIHARLIRSGESGDQYLWTGFSVNLHVDDAESYYCNLMGEKPSAFVISRPNAEGRLEPFLITLSYDEATSHIEVDDRVDSVAMPAEVYRRLEAYVLEHYVPERKKKRKRDDWKKERERP